MGHYLEETGIATTQISLLREHTEIIRPPRALWVPFEMGRPLGPPGRPDFQRRVLRAALELLEAEAGPLIADFPDDAPISETEEEGWFCPVSFPPPTDEADAGGFRAAVEGEMSQLRPWYDMALERHERTTVGASGLQIEALGGFLTGFLKGTPAESPVAGIGVGALLKLASEDLKAFYQEAAAAMPGQASSEELADWFWRTTVAARMFAALKTTCATSDDASVRAIGERQLVPRIHLHRLPPD